MAVQQPAPVKRSLEKVHVSWVRLSARRIWGQFARCVAARTGGILFAAACLRDRASFAANAADWMCGASRMSRRDVATTQPCVLVTRGPAVARIARDHAVAIKWQGGGDQLCRLLRSLERRDQLFGRLNHCSSRQFDHATLADRAKSWQPHSHKGIARCLHHLLEVQG